MIIIEVKASQKQIDYIRILTSYPDTKDKDAEDVRNFLTQHKKERIEQLDKREASALINMLLRRSVKYTFPCGKEKTLSKSDYNSYNLFGELEACSHECETDVSNCKFWEDKTDTD